jgi:endoglucanase
MKQIHLIALTLALATLPFSRIAAQNGVDEVFKPLNPPEMEPIASHDTPAYHAAKLFMRGANLGNYLETPPGGGWGVEVSADEFAQMKREGFDHVRVPTGWSFHAGAAPDFTLSPEIFARSDFVVTNALSNQLAVLINIHGFEDLDKEPRSHADEFVKIWRQIAAHYRDFPDQLAFELDNEPHDKATTISMNPIYARAIEEIRRTNPRRTIFVEPGNYGSYGELKNLALPQDDNIVVSVHCYDPFFFTHQGAPWAGDDRKQTGIHFPGPPAQPLTPDPELHLKPYVLEWFKEYNTLPAAENPCGPLAFLGRLKYAREWSDHYGRPVHIGEFGCYTTADATSRANYYKAFREAAEAQKFGWCIWDWSAGFRYWDRESSRPMPGMREALFGKQ